MINNGNFQFFKCTIISTGQYYSFHGNITNNHLIKFICYILNRIEFIWTKWLKSCNNNIFHNFTFKIRATPDSSGTTQYFSPHGNNQHHERY